MFLLLSVSTFFVLEKKLSRIATLTLTILTLCSSLILNQTLKSSVFHSFIVFGLTFLAAFSFSSTYTFNLKRKFYSFQTTLIPLLSLGLFLISSKSNFNLSKKTLLAIFVGIVLGVIVDALQNLPFGFRSLKEYNFFRKYLQSKKTDVASLTEAFNLNYTNFSVAKELVSQIENQTLFFKSANLNKNLLHCLFYWTQQPSFNSMNPLSQKFNQLSFETFKRELVAFDLDDQDVDLLFNLIRCGCWKPGIFLLDQYLVSNKLSAKYPSTLIFVDKFLNDLKRVSFEDETIENWLKSYGETFRGTPVSQKIHLIYHNKDDWFHRDLRYASV